MSERTGLETGPLASRELLSLQRILADMAALVRTLDIVSIILAWACIAVAHTLPRFVENDAVSDPLVAVVALPLLLIIPRQLGILLRPLARRLVGGEIVQLSAVEAYLVAWLAGTCLLVIGLTIFTHWAGVPSTFAAIVVLIVATVSSVLYGLRSVAGRDARDPPGRAALLDQGWFILAALALASVPLAIVRASQPYPLLAGWGMFNYNYRVLEFLQADHIPITSGIHTPVHAGLLGVTSIATGADSFGLIWAGPLLLYAVYAAGVFAFARRILGSNLLALATLWVALWVLSFQSFQHLHAFGMRGMLLAMYPWVLLLMHRQLSALRESMPDVLFHVIIPLAAMAGVALTRWFLPTAFQVWALLLLGGLLVVLLRSLPERSRQSVGLLTLVAASLTLLHFVEGPIFFGLGLAFLLLLRWKTMPVEPRLVLAAAYAGVIGFIAVQATDVLSFDDESMITRFLLGSGRADATDIPFDRKLYLFRAGLAYPILGLLAFSAVRTLIWPNATHVAAIAVISLATFLLFLPESGMHRLVVPVIPLVGLSVALELRWLTQRLLNLRWKQAPPLWTGALVVAALIALTPALTSSLRTQMGLDSRLGFPIPTREHEYSNITPGEYQAAEWIAENSPQEWAIVSDPMTMFFMEGLTFHPQVAHKRAWVSESEYSLEDRGRLRWVYSLVFRAPTLDAALDEIESLTQDHPGFVLVISQRTLDWYLNPRDLFRRSWPGDRVALNADDLSSFCGYYEIERCPSMFFEDELLSVIYYREGVAVLVPVQQLDELDELAVQ